MSKPYSGIPLDEKRTWVVPRWLKEAFVAFAIVSVLAVGISKGVQHFGGVTDRARGAVEADQIDGKPAFSFRLPARGGGEVDLSSRRIYHVQSPFELDEPLARVWPPSGAGNPMRLVVTLYDLIPEVFASQYLADPGQRRRYRARLELVRAADRVLAISAASRDEAIARLGLDAARVTTIGAGISPAFRPPASRAEAAAEARRGMVRLEDPHLDRCPL